ncbi:MAG: rubrerythrin family protein [Clostridia bacterium]|nr:rubrerythrin family protein [Clostridia bacterium]
MPDLKGSKTYENLLKAMAGESMARNKYDWFASRAKKDGYEQIAEIFAETANNEKEHAKLWYKYLNGGSVADTMTNLHIAADGENDEWTSMYKEMAMDARSEGFIEIAERMEGVAKVEMEHEKRYRKFIENLEKGLVFTRDGQRVWMCRNCGHLHIGDEAPEKCPVCDHPRAYFELKKENY